MTTKNNNEPFWVLEYKYNEARSNLEGDCNCAETLYDAILCGANMTYFENEMVGYVEEDGEIELYENYEEYTEEQLKAIKVEFYSLGRDDDGYTVAYFEKAKE